jgi:ubiquitin C-terminal hydrolase
VADLIEALHVELTDSGNQSPVSKTVETNDQRLVNQKYEEWLKSYFNKQCLSPVSQLFYGHLIDVSACSNCDYIRYGFDYFATLPLDLTRKRLKQDSFSQYPLSNSWNPSKESFTMKSLVENFFRNEQIPDFKCQGCKIAGHMNKRQYLKVPPQCLLVFLKRFEQNGQNVVKLDEKVRLEDVLTIKSNIEQTTEYHYKPVGFVEHFGSLTAGHYTSKCSQKNGTWVAFSDDRTVTADVDYTKKPGSSALYLCALELQR